MAKLDKDLRPWSQVITGRFAKKMFVTDEFLVDLSFPVARARLADMAYGGSLTSASQRAHGDGLADLVRAGPRAAALAVARLAAVRRRELVTRDGSAVLSLR